MWAQLLVIALITGAVVGGVWGLTRPAYVGTYRQGAVAVDEAANPANVEFASLGWFVLLSGLIGAGVAVFAYLRGLTGPASLLWVTACAGAAGFSLFTFGGWSASLVTDTARSAQPVDGETVTFVPAMAPGVGWLVAPFVAGLLFYVFTVVAELQAGYDEAEADSD